MINRNFILSIAKTYKYKAFGDLKYESGTYDNNHRFAGKELDETGLYYFGARYYDKGIGRFLSTDPFPGYLSIPSTMHAYNYCGNNPTNFVDPLGMSWPGHWPPPRGAEEDCNDYLNRKYGNDKYAPADKGDYDSALWYDNSYYHFGHEDPDKLFTTTEVAKQLNTNYNQEDKKRNDLTPKGDQSVEYNITSMDATAVKQQSPEYLVPPPFNFKTIIKMPLISHGDKLFEKPTYWKKMSIMGSQPVYYLPPLVGGAIGFHFLGPEGGIAVFIIVGGGTYWYMHEKAVNNDYIENYDLDSHIYNPRR